MKGFSFLTRCLSLILIFNFAGTAVQLQAAPPVQKSDPPPESFPFPRSNEIELVPHLSGVAAPDTGPEHIDATTLYPYSRLTFQSYRNFADWNVYVGADDGSGQAQITFDGASDLHPRFNRGTTRIVFASRRTGNYEIFTMNPDGSGLAQLTFNGADDVQPYWSPDGSKIAFQAYRDGQPEVYVMNADGNGQVRLTTNGDYDGEPSWSPDGSKIAFVSKRTGGSGDYFVYVMNADGSGQVQLSGQAYSEGPVWSPDGTKIAYDSAGGDYWQNLWVMNADGSNQHVVFDEGGWAEAWARSWSPDSRYVAFTRIYFTQCGNNLCWTYAYLDAWDSQTGGVVRLSHNGADWRPDWQTTDAIAPSSSVNVLSAQSPSPIAVRWSGTDGGPAGIANYDVQVKDGAGGAWTNWQTNTAATSASYAGVGGHTYYFRARARDNAGNLEAYPASHDASTTVETLAPTSHVQALPAYSKDNLLVTWSGSDPGGSGIQTYDVQYRDGVGGIWTNWQVGVASTSAPFNGTAGHTYYFRARATDRAQNVGTYPANEDTLTTFYAWGIDGTVRDNTGVPVDDMNISTLPAGPEAFSSDAAGDYAAYVLTTTSAYTATWEKAGYGTLPATAFTGPTDAKLDVVLPPEDDIIVNGHFEASDLTSNGWQVGGTLTPTLTSTVRHTGQQSVLLGTTALSQTGASTVAQVVTIPPTATASALSFLYWPGQESPLKDGLVAYWNLDESGGARVDATGQGNDLSDNNTVTSGVGKVGQAAQFVAANQEYLSHPDNADLSTGDVDFTVAGWIYLDSKAGHGVVISKWDALTGYEYLLRYNVVYDRFTFEVSGNGSLGGITIVAANSVGSPAIAQWYWLVGWHDSVNNTLNVQINNGLVDSLAYSLGVYDGLSAVDVGFVPGFYYHDGRIDETGLWKRVLTPEERTSLYNNGQGCTYPFSTCGSLQPALTSVAGISSLSQAVTLPPTLTTPTLSFVYLPGQESPLKDNLVAYWPLDEAGGTRLDVTGRGNNLADNNTVVSGVGRVGNSAQFVAVNQEYLSHPDNADLSMGDVDFTISNWVYLDSPKTNGATLVKGNADTFSTFEYGWGYDGPNDRFSGSVVNNGSGASIPANSFGSPAANQWYFVVFWHDAAKDEIGISVNGVEDILPYSGGVWDTAFDFILGSDTCCRYWNGRIDEVGLWKRVLTTEERMALYNNGLGCTYPFTTCGPLQPNVVSTDNASTIAQSVTIPPTVTTPALSFMYWPGQESPLKDNLVAYWPLDEAGGTRMDVSGQGNDVSDNNTVLSTSGKVGNAAQFAETNQEYLSHPDTADLSVGDLDFTISAWVQLASKAYPARNIVSKWINGGQHEYSLYYNYDADRFRFAISSTGNDYPEVQADASGSPLLNTWYFVMAWHDSVNDTLNIQVNNGTVNSLPYANGGRDGAVPFLIGASNNGTLGLMDGLIDEVGFWKRVLTTEERTALYNNGAGCTYPFFTCSPLTTVEATSTQAPSLINQFTVSVDDGVTTTVLFSDTALTALDWTHQWADLSAWAGQTVTVTFTVDQGTGIVPVRVYLDEVTLGSAKPDVWATLEAPLSAPPGETFVYQLTYGNQGGALASGTYLTLTLPAEFTYSSVSLPPVISTTTELVWDIGSLAAQSGPYSIFVIATVSPTAPALTTVTSTLAITTTSELETANNTQQAGTFIGYQIFLPVARRD